MNLNEKSLYTLELDQVLAQLAAAAVSEEAKERAAALQPEHDAEEVRQLLAQTSAACRMVERKGTPAFQGLKPVAASLNRADRGGSLNPAELLRIAGVLRCARLVKAYADGVEPNVLDPLFIELTPNRFLEDRITSSILSEEEIADSASSTLADIRRHIRAANAKIRDSLQKVINSPTYSKYLQENIITIRSDRYVVPVKAEHKNDVPGLVHDVSGSGGTYFIEPIQAVNANNELRELLAKEQKEIERILAELSAEAANHRETIASDYEMLVQLDLIFAKARLSYEMHAMAPEVRTDGSLSLRRARHPLIDRKTCVPITVSLGVDFDALIITGPNTGGKTVTLKTIGLLTLMAECGLHLPTDDGSFISVFDAVLADIGDEQSIEQSLSTFSSHMKNIVEIVSSCDSSSLILFDELGAGTDPTEGAALAISVIEFCRRMGAKIAATTHYAELKVYGMKTDRVTNASCEFDVETLRPTYRLLVGVPGKSNAFNISRRLGLPEEIIKSARDLVNESDLNFEDVMDQLEQQRQAMEQARREAERLRLETEQQKQQSDRYYAEIKREREKAVQKARAEAQSIIETARLTANRTFEELKQMRRQMQENLDVQGLNAQQAALRRSLNEAEDQLGEKRAPTERPKPTREIVAGDTVELIKLGSKATVLAVNKDGSLQLQAGIMKVTAQKDEVYLLENESQSVKKFIERTTRELRAAPAASELDLRGMTTDEAIQAMDIFLDNAILGNLASVRIIHGKGTGALRKAVQAALRRRKDIVGFRLGVYGEGEDGVTVVQISE